MFHYVIHSFQDNSGTGMSSLEVKLLQNLVALHEELLYYIFLYLYRSYDSMEWEKRLEILEGYRMVPRTI